ncbi:MAG TPA: dTDP-4-dehydrorhamnose reductase [Mangrovimonas sp.]|nr:dTDP-4-dehydrorhamnose reductase [Mangrovimonas sp.]
MGTNVLVTGSNGQLGLTIKELYELNDEGLNFTFVSKEELDISNNQETTKIFTQNQFDYCINCAAYTNVEQAEVDVDEAFKVNAEGVQVLAHVCQLANVVLIHISTDYVFDGEAQQPYLESDVTKPINQYGKSKLKGEHYIQEIMERYFILRTSWLYSLHGKNFLKTIISKIEKKENLKVVNSQMGTPTSTVFLAQIIFQIIKTDFNCYGIYHATPNGKTTWYGFAKEIAKHFKDYDSHKIQPVEEFTSLAPRPKYSVMSNSKAKKERFVFEDWEYYLKETILRFELR